MKRMFELPPRRDKFLTIIAVVGLILALLVLFTRDAKAQDSTIYVLRVSGWPSVAQTLCMNPHTPFIIIRAEVPDSEVMGSFTHEMTHVQQMKKNGGCMAATNRYARDWRFRLAQEGEAYCAELKYFLKNATFDVKTALENIITILDIKANVDPDMLVPNGYKRYNRMSRQQVYDYFRKNCKEG